MKQATIPLYIRFGEKPQDGKSKISNTEHKELGISVWRAVKVNNQYYPLLPDEPNENAIADYFDMLLNSNSPVYLVTGEEIRFEGQDREPLLQNITILKDITNQFRERTGD